MSIAQGNVGAAIGLVCGAGAATAIGASIVFFPSLVKRASRRVLAASLGLSAGVMVYISFVEIFVKAVGGFVEAGIDEDMSYIYATLSFFGGVLVMMIVDFCVKRLSSRKPVRRDIDEDIQIVWNEDQGCCEMNDNDPSELEEIVAPHCVGCGADPVAELNEWHEKAELELRARNGADDDGTSPTSVGRKGSAVTESIMGDEESGCVNSKNNKTNSNSSSPSDGSSDDFVEHSTKQDEPQQQQSQQRQPRESTKTEGGEEPVVFVLENVPRDPEEDGFFRSPNRSKMSPKQEKKQLVKMGLGTALAIGLHNFPEGLATFVAALDDPSVGAVLAIAIGIHNIPEGLCVALPIYYATGNRWKAFLWGCLSGLSEPIAALLGWLVLAKAMTEDAYAILFGIVSGMMVMISLKELIPTAHRYDPEDTVVTYSIIVGMGIMGLSIVLFKI